MASESGDEYIRRTATFIRTNEPRLAEGGIQRRRRVGKVKGQSTGANAFNPLSWFGGEAAPSQQAPHPKPLVFTMDTHRLFYLLIRLEALGINVGSLDVKVDNPSRPMSYIGKFGEDKSDVMSLSSIRTSFSAVSRLSLGVGLWGRPEPPSVDQELKYIFSSFTKLPALSLRAPGPKQITEIANDPPNDNAVPLDVFRNLQTLTCSDIDPRTLLGWDKLADSLWSLTISRSGLDDISDIFIGAVLDDQARREGGSPTRKQRIIHGPSRQPSFDTSRLPDTISEDAEDVPPTSETETHPPPTSDTFTSKLSSSKWAFLRHLCLADNALTFLPSNPLPHLSSLTHLDLSSNLLVSVPPGLSSLYNLIYLNLSDNMIDSVLGIYKHLGQILTLNLARNRLDSLCGLERLMALERVDVRHNLLEDSGEVGRLASLPNIAEVWVEGNPFVDIEDEYRIKCFDFFWTEGKNIVLDGTPPGFYEKRNLTSPPPEQMSSSRPLSTAYSPPVVPIGAAAVPSAGPGSSSSSPAFSPLSSHNPSPYLAPTAASKARRKKPKRIVDLDGEGGDSSDGSRAPKASPAIKAIRVQNTSSAASTHQSEASSSSSIPPDSDTTPGLSAIRPVPVEARPPYKHRRSQTDAFFSSSSEQPFTPSMSASPSDRSMSISAKSRSQARRARVAASVFEVPKSAENRAVDEFKQADEFRARIEALRSDMGEGWLKVFSQSQAGQAGVNS